MRYVHIAIVTMYFPPETEPSAKKFLDFGRYWVKAGHRVTVLTGFPNYPDGKVRSEYLGKLGQTEYMDGVEVRRARHLTSPIGNFRRRLVAEASFGLAALLASLSIRQVDIVLASSPPLELMPLAAMISRGRRAKFVMEICDIWPDAAYALGVIREPSLLGRIAERVERSSYRAAHHLVVNSPGFGPHLTALGKSALDVTAIVNGSGLDEFPVPERPAENGSARQLEVVYAGNHGRAHGLQTVLKAFDCLKEEHVNLVFVGDGPEKHRLVSESQVHAALASFHPTIPPLALCERLARADMLLASVIPSPFFEKVVSVKVFDYLYVGKPIVCAAAGCTADIVHAAGAGIVVPPGDARALADAIRWMAEHPEERAKMGKAGHDYYMANYHRSKLAAKYLEVLEECVAERKRGKRQ